MIEQGEIGHIKSRTKNLYGEGEGENVSVIKEFIE